MKKWMLAIVFGICCVLSLSVIAQDRGPRGGGDRGGRRFDPEQMRERMLANYQEYLDLSDDEWEAIKPLMSKVMEKQWDTRGGMGRRWARGGDEDDQEETPSSELRAAVEDEDASSETIKEKLEAFRKEKKEKEDALKKAQDELRSVLTLRQEAKLVLRGMLE
ncbi:MAG: hypothetical protein ACLFUS_02630 [Candidatus Sumerlaeia bacterium]